MLLLDLLSGLSYTFQDGVTHSKKGPLTSLKKMLHKRASDCDGSNASVEISSFQVCVGLCGADKKNNYDSFIWHCAEYMY